MRIDVLTLFPEVMQPYLAASIPGRAQTAGLAEIHLHQLRDYSTDPHKKVDDRPFGGGPGMVLMCQPVIDAVNAIEKMDERTALRLLLTPQGRLFNQACAGELARHERLLLICGHYEGFDERIIEVLQPVEVSIGDFVLTGGELAALAVIDSVVRLVPGVLGNELAAGEESFQNNLLDYPQYTRPRDFQGRQAPDILLSGDHSKVAEWRRARSRERTRQRRPDLLDSEAGHTTIDRADNVASAPRGRRSMRQSMTSTSPTEGATQLGFDDFFRCSAGGTTSGHAAACSVA
jgi:tRNA (guanine37-N1)-methyltransferase